MTLKFLCISLLLVAVTHVNGQCNLVPGGGPDCLNLRGTQYLSTLTTQFGPFIEGASVNHLGHVFATNYGNANTLNQIGEVWPTQRMIFNDNTQGTYFNGIRFQSSTVAYAADINKRVVRLNLQVQGGQTVVTGGQTFCQNSSMIQPNDIALSRNGTIFTSGQEWQDNTDERHGDIWACTPTGAANRLEVLGRTNGIELSPDDTRLYVSESHNRGGSPYSQKIYVYDVNASAGTISNKRLFVDFQTLDGTVTHDIDGMRTDRNGNLFVTRNGGGNVAIFNNQGTHIGRIHLNFQRPTNIEFGGTQGTTVYIVGSCEPNWPGVTGCVDTIEVVTPGRAWSNLQ